MAFESNAVLEWLRNEWSEGRHHGTLLARQAARGMGCTVGNAADGLDELARNGLVTRRVKGESFGDRAVVLYDLTKAGRAAVRPDD